MQEINSSKEELKGISTLDEFCSIQPDGNYLITTDIESTPKGTSSNIKFNGNLDFDGHKLISKMIEKSFLFHDIGENGVIENIEIDVYFDNNYSIAWKFPLCEINNGKIRNVIVNLEESMPIYNNYIALIGQQNKGTIEKFVINMKEALYIQGSAGVLFLYNFGIIKDGYVYGKNIEVKDNTQKGHIGGIAQENHTNGKIENVYNLTTINVQNERSYNVGNIVYNNAASVNGAINNVYSVEINEKATDNFTKGPNIYTSKSKVKNSYYFSNNIIANSYDVNTSKIALRDARFQEETLNSNNSFNVDKLIEQGYFPQIKLPDVMPLQEYIELPKIKDEDLVDILHTDILEENSDSAKIKISVNNPFGETITKIEINNVKCDILEQSYKNGKSEIIANLYDPIVYVSNYDVKSITSKGAYNSEYTRKFKINERKINVDLYRKVYTIDDWKEIGKFPTENFIIENDLDFKNSINYTIKSNYKGTINGNGHTFRNVSGNLIDNLYGKLKNLFVENYINNPKMGNQGLIRYNYAEIENVHIKNSNVKMLEEDSIIQEYNIGMLVGVSLYGKVTNCSVTNSKIQIR